MPVPFVVSTGGYDSDHFPLVAHYDNIDLPQPIPINTAYLWVFSSANWDRFALLMSELQSLDLALEERVETFSSHL